MSTSLRDAPIPSGRGRSRYLLLALTIASAITCLFFTVASARWFLQQESDSVTFDHYSFTYTTDADESNTRYPNVRETIRWHLLGFRFRLTRQVLYPRWISHGDNQTIEWGPVATWAATVPGWACIALTAVLPIRWGIVFARQRRRAKVARGICVRCGYDLRASPERCPECGERRPPVSLCSST